MSTIKNITRFTYEFTSFQGWRVSFCRGQRHFTRYFSDKQYGGEQGALQAALRMRDTVLAMMKRFPNNPAQAFDLCRSKSAPTCFPRGLRPRKTAITV